MDAGGFSLKFLLSSLFILYAVSSVIQVMLRCALPEKAAEGRCLSVSQFCTNQRDKGENGFKDCDHLSNTWSEEWGNVLGWLIFLFLPRGPVFPQRKMSALTLILGDHHSCLLLFLSFFQYLITDLFTQIFTEYQLCAEFHSWY